MLPHSLHGSLTMASLSDIVFTPALGTTLAIPPGSPTACLYAASPRPVELIVKLENGTTTRLEQTSIPSVGGLLTYKASLPTSNLPARIKVHSADGTPFPGPDSLTVTGTASSHRRADCNFSSSITLSASEDAKSTLLDWLDESAWQGWAWQRMRPAWIEANFVPSMNVLAPDRLTHCLLLRPSDSDEGRNHAPDEVLAVFAASSRDAFVTLTGPRDQERPGVYARVRRVGASDTDVRVHVTGRLTASAGEKTAIRGAVQLARQKYGLPPASFDVASATSPFDRLGFCTWSSIGEDVPLTKANMSDLVRRLKKDAAAVPVGSLVIDDGWQDIRHGLNGHPKARGLWEFDTWEGMGCSLAELVALVKSELPSVKDVGVWMTLAGYWNSIAPGSPLEKRYGMKRYAIERSNVPGQRWPASGFDNQQSGTIADPEGRFYLLPPPERAAEFWKDYFGACAAAGVDFVKVDNQAYGSFLAGVEGGRAFVALWDAMFAAANETFGPNRVIHCMAHYERTFSGDIGLGIPSGNQKIIVRNSDDFGLKRPNIHRDHVHYNLYNAMLLEQLACVPDADMFMTHAQWPAYHAVLRAFFARGPILLADPPGTWDVDVVQKLIGMNTEGGWELVRATETARPLARNVWERALDGGHGPSIKAASSFGAHGASIVLWSSRADALHGTADILFEGDIVDALGETYQHPSTSENYALWLGDAGKAIPITLSREHVPAHATTLSDPLVTVSLPPETVEVITVVPFWRVGSQEIAVVGLVDKYAGLAAVTETREKGDKLVTEVNLAGVLGFILGPNRGSARTKIEVDGKAVEFSEEHVGLESSGPYLLKVDLSKIEPEDGKTVWTLEIGEATS